MLLNVGIDMILNVGIYMVLNAGIHTILNARIYMLLNVGIYMTANVGIYTTTIVSIDLFFSRRYEASVQILSSRYHITVTCCPAKENHQREYHHSASPTGFREENVEPAQEDLH